jgi:hypothetical protein
LGAAVSNFSLIWRLPASVQLAFDLQTALFIACPPLLSYLFYRAAVFAYGSLAEKVIRNVDLHRLGLIKQLGYASPKQVREENLLWNELGAFFVHADGLDPDRPIKTSG